MDMVCDSTFSPAVFPYELLFKFNFDLSPAVTEFISLKNLTAQLKCF